MDATACQTVYQDVKELRLKLKEKLTELKDIQQETNTNTTLFISRLLPSYSKGF